MLVEEWGYHEGCEFKVKTSYPNFCRTAELVNEYNFDTIRFTMFNRIMVLFSYS